jgi:DNA-binding winged helix-turn-helix (wHTH) protein/Flp pilus assembly protein TadD
MDFESAMEVTEIQLGTLKLQPHRQLLADGKPVPIGRKALEILSVLAEAGGGLVTKDELLEAVWPDLTIEENALQVHVAALRKVLGPEAHRLTTVRGIGYRLELLSRAHEGPQVRADRQEDSGKLPDSAGGSSSKPWLTRRNLAAGLIVTAAIGGAGFLALRDIRRSTPAEVEPLLAQAWQAWTQGTSEGNEQAIGLYRRATALDPEHADAWGFLGCAYADRAHNWVSSAEQPALRERAREAGRRALRLEPKNAYGRAAVAYAQPMRGNWWSMEREFRQATRDQPGKRLITYSLALLFTRVGRLTEAADLFGQLRGNAPTATQYFFHVTSLWGSGQLGEAERLLEEASSIYATHPWIWLTRFDMLMFGGRPGAAIAFAQDKGARPGDLSDEWLNQRVAVAQAMLSEKQEDAQAVAKDLMREARVSSVLAARAVQDNSGLGRLNEAFSVAEAYFFSRGFAIPDQQTATGEPFNVTLDQRQTGFLFLPPLRAMRADPRFNGLVQELGLARYWRDAGVQPDYRRV